MKENEEDIKKERPIVFIEWNNYYYKNVHITSCSHQNTLSSLSNLEQNEKVRGIVIPNLETYYKAIITKRICHWHKTVVQTNRRE